MAHQAWRGWTALVLGVAGVVLVAGIGLAAVVAALVGGDQGLRAPSVAEEPGLEPAAPAPSSTTLEPTPAPLRTPPKMPTPVTSRPPQEARFGTALAVLATLAVKGRAPRTGYDRDLYGQAWLDTNRNGCDTRNDMLRRDLTGAQVRPGTQGCLVEAGTLADPYSGTAIRFVRGDSLVDIDHVVALSNAWQTGAARWPMRKRAAFANDPMNLLAVDMSLNRQKGAGDAATWLPPQKGYRCAYVARQVSVKAKYGLWVTPPEREAMRGILGTCPGEPVLRGGAPVLAPFDVAEPRRTPSAPPPNPPPGPAPLIGGGSTHYENCDAVRAAGADPIRVGDPGFDDHLDRDGDGVACE